MSPTSNERKRQETRTYSLTEAADILGIGRTTAYDLAQRGEFPTRVLCIGRSKKVVKADLERFLAGDEP